MHKCLIAEFRRIHREAVTATGAQLVRFAQGCGFDPRRVDRYPMGIRSSCAVASAESVGERQALERYLDSMEKADGKSRRPVSIRGQCSFGAGKAEAAS